MISIRISGANIVVFSQHKLANILNFVIEFEKGAGHGVMLNRLDVREVILFAVYGISQYVFTVWPNERVESGAEENEKNRARDGKPFVVQRTP
ncbi:hypothetical protein DdX_16341 [Ditylenchus destructor]|uniref:Uncharacterized protein n=1 Tax=Ditylenchus destructor TaxID=166010 RepID=A0AAD4MN59_9BILA|nr:hypothetical protein DdX_16341 [Ditylenchus destructor]